MDAFFAFPCHGCLSFFSFSGCCVKCTILTLTGKISSYTIAVSYNPTPLQGLSAMSSVDNCNEEKNFVEFRRKVRAAEVLSAAMEHLLRSVNFSGRISVVVQNGRVLKSGYEEGFFRQRDTASMLESGVALEP